VSHISRRDALRLAGAGLAGATAGAPAPAAARGPKGKYLILSCDGGGIRGLLTARIVQRLQEELSREKGAAGNIDFCARVDCFAGTSTGGIIALGLAAGLPPERLVKLYKDDAENIFKPFAPDDKGVAESAYYRAVTAALKKLDETSALLPGRVIPGGWSDRSDGLFFPQYNAAVLRQVLERALGKDLTLGKLAPARAGLVTTFHLGKSDQAWRPVILHNLPAADDDARLGRAMTVVDAALCTSAAPVYFAPHYVEGAGYFTDGGVFANNPGVAALATALRTGRPLDGVRLLSIGTGSVRSHMKVPPWKHLDEKTRGTRCGALAWLWPKAEDGVPAVPLVAAMLDAGAGADEFYCQCLLRGGYARIQVQLEKGIALDDVSAIPRLIELADAYFDSPRWKAVDKKWLLETYLA
jgi:predicted acylesterase/phospholipase RssA